VKLAWAAFMNMVNAIHHFRILHDDLLKDNIMLHFPINKPNVVYIGMCDWGEVEHMQEVTPFLYVFAKEHDFINVKKVRCWVAP
jgi:hypothetical protein